MVACEAQPSPALPDAETEASHFLCIEDSLSPNSIGLLKIRITLNVAVNYRPSLRLIAGPETFHSLNTMTAPPIALTIPKGREITGGDLLAQSFKASGVDVAFGIHGGHLDAFLMGCVHADIKLVDTRHESCAVQAAEGYSKVAGKIGLCFVTANSGYRAFLRSK